ncbi:MAG: hypothetical protein KME31_28235 [Tolypothrix carrinoi HA7290-LM1]|nr:hypothetical protein [Tolypothrix carrinoi HA7290-LM1]
MRREGGEGERGGEGDKGTRGTRRQGDKGSQRRAEVPSVEEPVRCGGSLRCSTWRATGVDKGDRVSSIFNND